jgi:CO/xanthine dehydrogenase FAD-binding subunit
MPVTVKTFASFGEAASALSSDRGARYLGGGTLVMRAINEGDISISTVVRATDQALSRIDVASARVTIGAGVTFARILAERDLAFLHAPARSIGGPAVRNMGTVGGNLFAPSPYGDFTVALLALDATVSVQGGLGARDMPIEEFLQSRERQSGALVLAVSCQRPASADAFRYRKIARIKPKGGSGSRWPHLPAGGGRISGARIALDRWRRRRYAQGRRARTGGAFARRRRDQRCRRGCNGGCIARRQRPWQRLVPPRDRRRPSAPPAVRPGVSIDDQDPAPVSSQRPRRRFVRRRRRQSAGRAA